MQADQYRRPVWEGAKLKEGRRSEVGLHPVSRTLATQASSGRTRAEEMIEIGFSLHVLLQICLTFLSLSPLSRRSKKKMIPT